MIATAYVLPVSEKDQRKSARWLLRRKRGKGYPASDTEIDRTVIELNKAKPLRENGTCPVCRNRILTSGDMTIIKAKNGVCLVERTGTYFARCPNCGQLVSWNAKNG